MPVKSFKDFCKSAKIEYKIIIGYSKTRCLDV